MKWADLLNDLRLWIADIYRTQGWQAAAITLAVVVFLIAGLAYLFHLPLGEMLGAQ